MEKKFVIGQAVETVAAYTENDLMKKYAWADNRDLTGTFYVVRYCPTGNGAVQLSRTETGFTGMPLWVNQDELMAITAPDTAPVIREVGNTLTTTEVAKYCKAGDELECVVGIHYKRGKYYTVVETPSGRAGLPREMGTGFLYSGKSQFRIVALAEDKPVETVKLVELDPRGPVGPTGPTGVAGTIGQADPMLALEAPVPAVEAIDTTNEGKLTLENMPRAAALAIIEAQLDGKEIEVFDHWDGKWWATTDPSFHRRSIYRIKPELTEAQKRVIALKKEIAELEAEL